MSKTLHFLRIKNVDRARRAAARAPRASRCRRLRAVHELSKWRRVRLAIARLRLVRFVRALPARRLERLVRRFVRCGLDVVQRWLRRPRDIELHAACSRRASDLEPARAAVVREHVPGL